MAGEDDAQSGDRTEAATPRRLEQARQDGQVAMSREVVGWSALAAGTLGASLALPAGGTEMLRAMRALLARGHELAMAEAARALAVEALWAVLPVAGAAALGAVAATLLQTGLLISTKGLVPRLDKISPWAGLKRLVSPESAVEFLRTLIKLALVGAALWHALGDLRDIQAMLHAPPGALPAAAGEAALRLMKAALVAFAGIALLDLLWVRHRHAARLRMSRQDLKEEARDQEGDPMLKARRRQMRQVQGRRRMMAAVPRAAVVVTNPTHYAVALAYGADSAAPRVVAKGVDAMAARIRAAAQEAGVPLVANPPLARALWRLEVDAEIPPEHYQAVAEIIAYVWRQRGAGAQP
ncbi:EscU/YscU/HrcU family type III secretion system export apparatus switch protein [Falsiroseomonas selenitidurans]|uniref:EscU/YscU/HrcU family type III secretion system export apparatus switch protein n=1 Tax=Falsiroseomonas selenitidurans TaxID=2716335 RepID=A0ABX1E904_9PROT|nr:EscU/YscU/HrcU family type III secretion system export apparatus switch protein [Falsiroseomonas selenitidurans]NKC33676.1 EscU/YscU/HrcU family type III secretion system export apparatus switch protein [Falsiroseomonas selenitidurans]